MLERAHGGGAGTSKNPPSLGDRDVSQTCDGRGEETWETMANRSFHDSRLDLRLEDAVVAGDICMMRGWMCAYLHST